MSFFDTILLLHSFETLVEGHFSRAEQGGGIVALSKCCLTLRGKNEVFFKSMSCYGDFVITGNRDLGLCCGLINMEVKI